MLNRIACVIVFIVGASLVASCADATDGVEIKLDAHTLLIELQDILEETPNTEAGNRAAIKKIRVWQKAKLRQLQAQGKSAKYDFEKQYRWEPQTSDPCSLACTEVLFSPPDKPHPKCGSCSLKMMMDLIPDDEHKKKGEAWVNVRRYPPVGEHGPLNLEGRTVSALIYAPWGAKGVSNKPNGLQLFVRDVNELSQYGGWCNIKDATWFEVSLTVKPYDPNDKDRHTKLGFDPTRIEVVGVKMAAGDGSKKPYKGPIYVDNFDWQ